MPANLTQDYLNAEKKFRAAGTNEEKIAALEEMIRVIPKHKGTDHMQADLKRRLSKLRQEAGQKKGAAKRSTSHFVEPEGIGQVFLVGPPNTGKSSLLDKLTAAGPLVAEYPFTTRIYQPGMMRHEDVWIQLVDMPPISSEFSESWIPSVVRYGDMVALVVDLSNDDILDHLDYLLGFLEDGKVHLARQGEETGQFSTGMASLPTLLVCTHASSDGAAERKSLLTEVLGDQAFPMVEVEILQPETLERFREAVYQMLGRVRVYTKQPGKPADMDAPFVLDRGDTVTDLAQKIHRGLADGLQFARVWGPGKYEGQRVNRDYVLEEKDVIELHF